MLDIFTLTSDRLIVRPLQMDDLDTIYMIMEQAFGAEEDSVSAYQERKEWLEWTIQNYTALARMYQPPYGERAIVLRASGELIGAVGIVPCIGPFDTLPFFAEGLQSPSRLHSTEMGLFWALGDAYRGQGYATEAAKMIVDYLFNNWSLKRVIATTAYDNLNSQAVMQRLGMSIQRNPHPEPEWFQIIGVLENPKLSQS